MIHIFTQTLKTINTACPSVWMLAAAVTWLSFPQSGKLAPLSIQTLIFTHITLPHCLLRSLCPSQTFCFSLLVSLWFTPISPVSHMRDHTHTNTRFDSHSGQHVSTDNHLRCSTLTETLNLWILTHTTTSGDKSKILVVEWYIWTFRLSKNTHVSSA